MGLLIQLLSLVTCLFKIYTLNNSDLNCAVLLIHRFFKLNTYSSTIRPQAGWTPICGTVDVRGLTAKLYMDFRLCGVSKPLTPVLFKGQLYLIIYELHIFFHLFTSFQNELVLLHHSKVPNTSFLSIIYGLMDLSTFMFSSIALL